MTFNNSGFCLTLGKEETVWKIEGRKKNEAGLSPEGGYAGLCLLDAPPWATYSTSSHHLLCLKVLFWLCVPALSLRFPLSLAVFVNEFIFSDVRVHSLFPLDFDWDRRTLYNIEGSKPQIWNIINWYVLNKKASKSKPKLIHLWEDLPNKRTMF